MRFLARINWLARFGFTMRAALYLMLGFLALDDAAGHGTASAFDVLRRVPGGRAIAVLGAAGLTCFAVFQIVDSVLNLDERHGRLLGWASRVGWLGTGVAYAVIAFIGGKLALLGGDADSGEAGAQASRDAMHGFGGVLATLAWLIVRAGLTKRAQPLGMGPAIDDLKRMDLSGGRAEPHRVRNLQPAPGLVSSPRRTRRIRGAEPGRGRRVRLIHAASRSSKPRTGGFRSCAFRRPPTSSPLASSRASA